jgi:hypothetical protein
MTLVNTVHQRRAILLAIEKVLPVPQGPTNCPLPARYPDSVPEIDQHIDDLIELIRTDDLRNESSAVRIRNGICSRCPHQFPERYCAFRQFGGCVPYRYAEQIARAVIAVLGDTRGC